MAAPDPLTSLFLARLGRPEAAADEVVRVALERATTAWPGLHVPPEEFVQDLAARLPPGPLGEALGTCCVEDLWLACACRRGDRAGLEEFERRVIPEARAALLARREAPEVVEEALQALRERLFVNGERAGRIAEYSGRGPLVAWVRMAALRLVLNLKRGKAMGGRTEVPSQLEAPAAPPELGYVKARYRADFKAAFEEAFRALTPRERTLLRLHLLDGLSTAKLAKVYRADASTVRRWIAEARRRLLDETRAALGRRIGAGDGELESVMGALITQLEDSVRRILGGSRDENG